MMVARAAPSGAQTAPSPRINVGDMERWASLAGGGLLALYGLTSRDKLSQVLCPVLGAALAYRGLSGHCPVYQALNFSTARPRGLATAVPAGQGVRVDCSVTVNRPAAELYRAWRHLDYLPRFMTHLQEVRLTDPKRSHWVARAPLGMSVEWDAEIINERENELIAWRSLAGSQVDTAGSVRFLPLPGGRGTEVRVELKYDPPAGKLGATIAWLLGDAPEQQVRQDMERFKRLAEAGELAASRIPATI